MKSVSGMTLLFESAVSPDRCIGSNRTHQKRINDDAEGKPGNAGGYQVKVPQQKLSRGVQSARNVFVRIKGFHVFFLGTPDARRVGRPKRLRRLDQSGENLFNDLRTDEQSHGGGNAAYGTHDGAANHADT